ncbi:MAG: glycosyltransferase [Solirubrobacteraceae bacterium]
MTSICLCMIVRDEAAVIERCLRSARGLIQTWVICDTGSTDRTKDLIAQALEGVPGELHECDWVNFGHNRTELMEHAYGRADYLLLLDADMTISYEESYIRTITADSYLLRHQENPEYWVKRLVRGDRRWRFVGATHEYITTDGTDRTEKLDGIVIHHHADGGTRPEKFQRDLALLSGELERNPHDARSVFYLAQTYRDLDRLEEAIELYRRRASMGGWEEEVFYSQYQVGVLSERVGDHAGAVTCLLEAWELRPSRAEPLYELAWMFRTRGLHHPAHMIAARGIGIPVPDDTLFVHRWVYEWGLLFEYSIAAYWTGRHKAALDACDRLLAMSSLPAAYRQQTKANRAYCVSALGADATGRVNTTGDIPSLISAVSPG